MGKQKQQIPELIVPKGYELEDLYDLDDTGYEHGEPIYSEEVRVTFERNDSNRK